MAGNNNANTRGSNAGNRRRSKKNKSGGNRSGGGGPPAAVGAGYIAQGPAVVRGIGPTVRFSNTEFVTDITAPLTTVTTPVVTISINPANASFCPWLSRIAVGYELYRFRKLILRYTPTCSSSTAGMVVMAIDFDASDAPPNNKQTMSAYEGAVRGNVWSKVSSSIPLTAGWYYTGMSGGVSNPSNTDVKFYDIGKLYVGVYNHTATMAVGELSIDYDVEFAKPDYSIPTGLSEKVVPVGSALSNIAGNSQTITGNTVFSLSSAGLSTGQVKMTASVAGEFMVNLVGFVTASSTIGGNIFQNIEQNDPNSYQTQLIPFDDGVVTGTAANTQYIYNYTFSVSVVPGTYLILTAIPTITALNFLRMRVANYRKALG